MFENVHIDWHITSHENDGSTDFSDDETLDDHSSYPKLINNNNNNALRTPERSTNRCKF